MSRQPAAVLPCAARQYGGHTCRKAAVAASAVTAVVSLAAIGAVRRPRPTALAQDPRRPGTIPRYPLRSAPAQSETFRRSRAPSGRGRGSAMVTVGDQKLPCGVGRAGASGSTCNTCGLDRELVARESCGRTTARLAGHARCPEYRAAPSTAPATATAGGPAGDQRGRFRLAPPPLRHDHHGCPDRPTLRGSARRRGGHPGVLAAQISWCRGVPGRLSHLCRSRPPSPARHGTGQRPMAPLAKSLRQSPTRFCPDLLLGVTTDCGPEPNDLQSPGGLLGLHRQNEPNLARGSCISYVITGWLLALAWRWGPPPQPESTRSDQIRRADQIGPYSGRTSVTPSFECFARREPTRYRPLKRGTERVWASRHSRLRTGAALLGG